MDAKRSIKILAIGNSFSVDATEYLWSILHDAGFEEIIIGNLYYPGCSLDMHYQNSLTDSRAYIYEFFYKNTSGKWEATPNGKLDDALAEEEWDAVTMQQASGYSGEEASYSRLGSLYAYVKSRVPKSCKFYWHMTWAYQQDTDHPEFPKYDSDQMTMYNAVCNAVKAKVIPTGYFEAVIPSGTAVQNLRTSYFGDTLTRDGYHMSYEHGRYLTSLAWLAAFGVELDDITWTPIEEMALDLPAMKEAVKNAMENPFEVTNSSYTRRTVQSIDHRNILSF